MSGNNDRGFRGCRISEQALLAQQVDFLDVMEDVNADTLEFQRQVQRYPGGPRPLVVVASDCMNGRDLPQLVQDRRSPDITGVNDVPDARERTYRFRPKQPMGIRDEANRCHLSIVPGRGPGAQSGRFSDCEKSLTQSSRAHGVNCGTVSTTGAAGRQFHTLEKMTAERFGGVGNQDVGQQSNLARNRGSMREWPQWRRRTRKVTRDVNEAN